MVKVKKEYLSDLLSDNKRYKIPFFQRCYVWKEENWEDLWNGILSLYTNNKKKEYFTGSIIIKSSDTYDEVGMCYLIDGQQRLTTLSIILKALENECNQEDDSELIDEIIKRLIFKDNKGKLHLRIEPGHLDKKCYETIINSENHPDKDDTNFKKHKLWKCYHFFKNKITELDIKNLNDKRKLKEVIDGDQDGSDKKYDSGRIALIRVGLDNNDDEQEIFDTLNSLGVELSTAELVKNYIFREYFIKGNLEKVYQEYWKDIFEINKDETSWWNTVITRGRKRRTNIDIFLFSFLVIKMKQKNLIKNKEIQIEYLFREYKSLINKHRDKIIDFLEELKQYAILYREKFPLAKDIDIIKFSNWNERLFLTLNILTTTPYPFILYYYYQNRDDKSRSKFAQILNSYIIRREVCGLTAKDYNNFFVDAIYYMAKENKSFQQILNEHSENEARCYPNNDEFKKKFLVTNRIKNPALNLILYSIALKQFSNPKMDLNSIPYKNSVEHIMPRKWINTEWNSGKMKPEQVENRNNIINTIGNVTLVNNSLNASMQNKVWKEKKKVLKENSILLITKNYLNRPSWNEKEIEKRANDLHKIAKNIWPGIEDKQ